MKKKFLLQVTGIALIGLFCLPFFITSGDEPWPLSKKQAQSLLSIIRKYPLTEAQRDFYDASLYYPHSSYPRKTGAVALTKQAILKKQLDYWFKNVPIELSKNFIKLSLKLIPLLNGVDVSAVLDLIEKYTVKKATDYAMDWFLQNEIKIGAGEGEYSFLSYQKSWQTLNIPYLIVYDPKNQSIIAEFYSTHPIEPPTNRGSLGGPEMALDWLSSTCWPWDLWIHNEKNRDNDGKLEPFIIRIKGFVKEDRHGLFSWDKTKGKIILEVDFDKPVPQITSGDIVWKSGTAMKIQFVKNKFINPALEKLETLKEKVSKAKETVEKIIEGLGDIVEQADTEAAIGNRISFKNITTEEKETKTAITMKKEPSRESSLLPAMKHIEEKEIEESPVEEVEPPEIEEKAEKEPETEEQEEEIAEPPEKKEEIKEKKTEKAITFCSIDNIKNSSFSSLVFNEIAWMGTKNSANDEWIELKNISGSLIDLKNWQIIDKKEQIKISLEGFLGPGELFLLERTDDSSAPNVKADLTFAGNINNTEEELYLFNNNCLLEDRVSANPYWPAGDNSTKRSMERKDDLSWQTSKDIGGTPKAQNSSGKAKVVAGGAYSAPQPIQKSPTPEVIEPEAKPLKIIITEVQIGTASSSDEDFVELFNLSSSSADITGCKLKKRSSTGNNYSIRSFPEGSIIAPNSYFLWANSEYQDIKSDTTSTQTLSNNNSIAFFDKNDSILDQLGWGESKDAFHETEVFPKNPEKGQSLSRKYDEQYQDTDNNKEDFEIGVPTPGKENQKLEAEEIVLEQKLLPSIKAFTAIPSAERKGIDLFWIATSSKKYIVKQSNTEITEESWEQAELISSSIESFDDIKRISLRNLGTDNTLYFGLKFISPDGATSSPAITKTKPLPAFQYNEDNTITDPYTKLTWPKDAKNEASQYGTTTTQYEAKLFLGTSTASFFGFDDWRLPNFKELSSIINYGEKVFIDSLFENIEKAKYWSSDKWIVHSGYPGVPSEYKAWFVDFENGNIETEQFKGNDSPQYYFLPVRGNALRGGMPDDDFDFLIRNGDGTVSDPRTNLMWAQYNFAQIKSSNRMKWVHAMKFAMNRVLCNDGTFQGSLKEEGDCSQNQGVKYDDWRLPNLHELILMTKRGGSWALPWSGLSYFYWSSTLFDNEHAWRAGNGDLVGKIAIEKTSRKLNVQVVRDIN